MEKNTPIIVANTQWDLIHEDDERIIVSFLNFGEGSTKHFQMIPKKMVRKITKLKEVK